MAPFEKLIWTIYVNWIELNRLESLVLESFHSGYFSAC